MKVLDIGPIFERGASFSDRYLSINDVLNQLSEDVGVDLWILDSLWWVGFNPARNYLILVALIPSGGALPLRQLTRCCESPAFAPTWISGF